MSHFCPHQFAKDMNIEWAEKFKAIQVINSCLNEIGVNSIVNSEVYIKLMHNDITIRGKGEYYLNHDNGVLTIWSKDDILDIGMLQVTESAPAARFSLSDPECFEKIKALVT